MIAKSLNAIIDGEQKEFLKLEIHDLVVKAQYGTSASRSLGNHSQLTFKSSHSSPTYQRSNIEQTLSSPNFNSNEYIFTLFKHGLLERMFLCFLLNLSLSHKSFMTKSPSLELV